MQRLLANEDEDTGILVDDSLALHRGDLAAGKKPDNRKMGQVFG